MFPILGMEMVSTVGNGGPWAYFGCASFEPRWDAFAEDCLHHSSKPAPAFAHVWFPLDKGSQFEKQCSQKQEAEWGNSVINNTWRATRTNLDLAGQAPWQIVVKDLKSALPELSKKGIDCVVVDITAMPRICFFPVIEYLLTHSSIRTIAAVYAEPDTYHRGALTSEPTQPVVVPPFDHLPPNASQSTKVAWIPILGFGSYFVETIFQAISSYHIGSRIFPMVGFPAYEPMFLERVLADSGRVIVNTARFHGVQEQFLYAGAADPFDTREAIVRLVDSSGSDIHWIGSPIGPKPMALGMLLAARDKSITIMTAQARTYHPDYSSGRGNVHGYFLRRSGAKAY